MSGERTFDINLLTPELREDPGFLGDRRPRDLYLWAVIATVMIWLGLWGWYSCRERQQEEKLASLRAGLASVKPTHSPDDDPIRQLARKEAEIRDIRARAVRFTRVLDQIESTIPSGVRLDEVAGSGGQLTCKGMAPDYPSLAQFLSSLDRCRGLNDIRCLQAENTVQGVRFEIAARVSQ